MTSQPLLITEDPDVAEDIRRLSAVAGQQLDQGTDPGNVGPGWRTAPIVLLDGPAAVEVARDRLPRRPGVLVLGSRADSEFWRAAFEIGAEAVLTLPEEEARLVDLLAESGQGHAPRSGRVLAVLGGCGGAGASVLATATACMAAGRGDRCLLLDCDPLGGGLDLVLGTEQEPGLRWSGLTVTGGRLSSSALREALPQRRIGSGALSVLSCDRENAPAGLTPHAVRAVIDAGQRAGETVVCDLPRSLPDPAAAALRMADRTVVVVPADVRACAAAARLVVALGDAPAGAVSAVVRGPACSGLTVADVGRAVGIDVLTGMRGHPGLTAAMDRHGLAAAPARSRGPLSRAARTVLAALDSTAVPVGNATVGAA